MKWINEDGILYPTQGVIEFLDTPGPGVFQVTTSPNPMDKRLGLMKLSDKFEFDFKIYDVGCEEIVEKIKKVWNSREYNKNLGVIFNGTKGTGKTVKAKLLCNDIGLPVIIVNSDFDGDILPFITSLNFECVVFLDEAEKMFDSSPETLLKLIDGVYNVTRKLYLLTTNKLSVDDNLIDRPGRIRYIQEFGNLTAKAISECIDDNLKNPEYKDLITELVDRLEFSTIDILKNIIEEVNILGPDSIKSEVRNLNIPLSQYSFDIVGFEDINPDIDGIAEILRIAEEIKVKHKDCEKLTTREFLREWVKDDDGDYEYGYDLVCNEMEKTYSREFKIRTTSSELARGLKTDYGKVLKVFDDFPGFFTFKFVGSNEDELLCFIQEKHKPAGLWNIL